MSLFVQISDFESGKLHISTTCYTDNSLQDCIDEVEKCILIELLGCDLYELMVADWDVATQSFTDARFTDIFNPFCKNDGCGLIKSDGIKQMIKHFVYFEFVRGQISENRTTGEKQAIQENSTGVTPNQYGLFNTYNKGVHTYRAIQYCFCISNLYPEQMGINKDLMSWL